MHDLSYTGVWFRVKRDVVLTGRKDDSTCKTRERSRPSHAQEFLAAFQDLLKRYRIEGQGLGLKEGW